jgi:hypothetical protein
MLLSSLGLQLGLLNQTSVLVSEDDCREAVLDLNKLRWVRAEDLGDGYDVSDILCYDIYPCYANIANVVS